MEENKLVIVKVFQKGVSIHSTRTLTVFATFELLKNNDVSMRMNKG